MGYGFKVEISGDYALFTRPEFKVERCSYDIITFSSKRDIGIRLLETCDQVYNR